MGHGPPRELESDSDPERTLPAPLASKLDAALAKMDQYDEGFRVARTEERDALLAKRWAKMSKEILDQLQEIISVLHAYHQVSLDVGSEGGGRGTRPFVEETAQKFERLYLILEEDGSVLAQSGSMTLARSPLADVDYELLEKLVVVWIVKSIDARTRGASHRD